MSLVFMSDEEGDVSDEGIWLRIAVAPTGKVAHDLFVEAVDRIARRTLRARDLPLTERYILEMRNTVSSKLARRVENAKATREPVGKADQDVKIKLDVPEGDEEVGEVWATMSQNPWIREEFWLAQEGELLEETDLEVGSVLPFLKDEADFYSRLETAVASIGMRTKAVLGGIDPDDEEDFNAALRYVLIVTAHKMRMEAHDQAQYRDIPDFGDDEL